jgi:FkbM family methyltransferase
MFRTHRMIRKHIVLERLSPAQRLRLLLPPRIRAIKLGTRLLRNESFRVPGSIILNGVRTRISLPSDSGASSIFREVLLYNCYALDQIRRPIRTVLDIGANVGIFCLAARNAFPEATIHAYEPNIGLEPYLSVQAEAARCRYFLEAVGAEGGRVTLEAPESSGHARSRPDPDGPIPCVSLSQAIQRLGGGYPPKGGSIDLAKVDCEGAEWDLWRDREAWTRIRNVSLEYHLWPNHTHDEAAEVITQLGFGIRQQICGAQVGLLLASRAES